VSDAGNQPLLPEIRAAEVAAPSSGFPSGAVLTFEVLAHRATNQRRDRPVVDGSHKLKPLTLLALDLGRDDDFSAPGTSCLAYAKWTTYKRRLDAWPSSSRACTRLRTRSTRSSRSRRDPRGGPGAARLQRPGPAALGRWAQLATSASCPCHLARNQRNCTLEPIQSESSCGRKPGSGSGRSGRTSPRRLRRTPEPQPASRVRTQAKQSSSRLPLVRHARPARRTPTGTPAALSSYFARDYYARLRDLTRLMLR
jgi:hypothetical protein